jgi:DNA repair exonuclease SbcCD ATPase subunit
MLSIKHITLHNFRGIRGKLEFHFHEQPGFYFVQGQNLKEPALGANGAGKSTIFADGPYWILTGKTIMSQRPGSSIENWGLDKTAMYGELTLDINDNSYLIKRGRNPSVLTINQRTVEQREIDKLIPLSDSALRRTLLLGQRSSMFLDLRPEEKSRLFSDTLDLDIWLRAADLAGEQLRSKERDATKIDSSVASVSGSMNEVRDQHEIAVNKEDEFVQNHDTRLAALIAIGRAEASKHDALKARAGEAQTRLNDFALSSTSNDELLAGRAQERVLRDFVIKLDSALSQSRRSLEKLDRQITIYNESKICPECKQPVTEQHIHTRKQELIQEREQTQERNTEIQLEIDEIETNLVKLLQIIERLEQANQQSVTIKHEVSLLEQQVAMQERVFIQAMNYIKTVENEVNPYTALCNELETRYNNLKEQRNTLLERQDAINAEIEILKFWQNGYRDIRLQQIDTTLLELEVATNRNANALGLQGWEIQFDTERETKSGTVSHGFSIILFPPGQNQPVSWDSYSGGEAQRWQLAVTFGLSEVLLSRAGIEPDFEILDEPTGFLSQEGIDDLLECLHARAHELQRRIYLIDHRSLERGSFDGIVTVVKTEQGISIQ